MIDGEAGTKSRSGGPNGDCGTAGCVGASVGILRRPISGSVGVTTRAATLLVDDSRSSLMLATDSPLACIEGGGRAGLREDLAPEG